MEKSPTQIKEISYGLDSKFKSPGKQDDSIIAASAEPTSDILESPTNSPTKHTAQSIEIKPNLVEETAPGNLGTQSITLQSPRHTPYRLPERKRSIPATPTSTLRVSTIMRDITKFLHPKSAPNTPIPAQNDEHELHTMARDGKNTPMTLSTPPSPEEATSREAARHQAHANRVMAKKGGLEIQRFRMQEETEQGAFQDAKDAIDKANERTNRVEEFVSTIPLNSTKPPSEARSQRSLHLPRRDTHRQNDAEDTLSRYSQPSNPPSIAPNVSIPDIVSPTHVPFSVLIAAFLVYFSTQGLNQAFGVFQAFYMTTFLRSTNAATTSLIGATQIALLFLLANLTPWLAQYGRSKHALGVGSLLLFAGMMTTSWSKSWWSGFLCQGIVSGVGMGCVWGTGNDILNSSQTPIKGWMTAFVSSGGAVGGVVYSILGAQLLYRIGFAWTVRVIAIVVFMTLLAANMLLWWSIPTILPPIRPFRTQSIANKAVVEPSFLCFWCGLAMTLCGIYAIFYFSIANSLAQKHDWYQSSAILIAFNAASVVGRLAPIVSETSFRPVTMVTMSAFLGSICLFVGITTTYVGSLLVVCGFGVVVGTIQSLFIIVVGQAVGDREGRRGWIFNVSALGCLVGPPIGGWFVDFSKAYLGVQLFAGAAMLVGGVLFFVRFYVSRRAPNIIV